MISAGDDGARVDGTVEITGFVTYAGEGFALVRSAPDLRPFRPSFAIRSTVNLAAVEPLEFVDR